MRVVVADDHAIFRSGLVSLLRTEGVDVVGEAADGLEAVALVKKLAPDAVVLDMNMPALNGVEARMQMMSEHPEVKAVVLTMFDDEASVVRAFQAGVEGYVLKTQAAEELLLALREVTSGNLYISPRVSEALVDGYLRGQQGSENQLTSRERHILQLVAEGNPTKVIARTLNLTVKTIESHRNRLMKKLNAENVAGLVKHAVREGVIKP